MRTNAEMYLDYFNNFLTVAGFAAYYNLTMLQATEMIESGREEHEMNVRSIKS